MSSRLSMLVVLLLLELMLLSLWLRLLRGCVKAPYQVWCPVRDQNDSEFQQQCQSKMCHKECGGIQSTHTMQESRKSVMQRNRRARSVLLRNNTFWPHSPDLLMRTSEEGIFFCSNRSPRNGNFCLFFCFVGHPIPTYLELSTSIFLAQIFKLGSESPSGSL